MGVSEPEYFCLSLLSMSGPISRKDIISRLEHTGHHPDSEIFARLKRKQYIDSINNDITISKQGREVFISILAQSKALEEQLLKHFSNDELLEANNFLKKLIKITGSDIPELW
jgi:3-hydroxy-9,10-secoandrosta-1,3,5(10)-triene-9,17-dione monooxygenase reductase component